MAPKVSFTDPPPYHINKVLLSYHSLSFLAFLQNIGYLFSHSSGVHLNFEPCCISTETDDKNARISFPGDTQHRLQTVARYQLLGDDKIMSCDISGENTAIFLLLTFHLETQSSCC